MMFSDLSNNMLTGTVSSYFCSVLCSASIQKCRLNNNNLAWVPSCIADKCDVPVSTTSLPVVPVLPLVTIVTCVGAFLVVMTVVVIVFTIRRRSNQAVIGASKPPETGTPLLDPLSTADTIQIIIKGANDVQHTMDIGCHDTVLLLKQKFEEKSGITAQNQILMYRSKLLRKLLLRSNQTNYY